MATRGRPKRNPVETLATKAFVHAVASEAQLPLTGYAFERHFDGLHQLREDGTLKHRTCAWDRIVNGATSPSEKTWSSVASRYPHAAQYQKLSLWRALKAGDQGEQYWLNFFHSLPMSMQTRVFIKGSSANSLSTLRRINSYATHYLLRIGDIEALACAFALMRCMWKMELPMDYQEIASATRELLTWTVMLEPFYSLRMEILAYLEKYILAKPKDTQLLIFYKPWPSERMERKLESKLELAHLAEALSLVYSKKDIPLFFYYLQEGNTASIIHELFLAENESIFNIRQDTTNGLMWLVQKLNKHYPKNQKIGMTLHNSQAAPPAH